MLATHVAKDGCSGSWWSCSLKDTLPCEKKEGRGAKGPFPGDWSPAPFCCPLGTVTAIHFSSHARDYSFLLIPHPGSPG